jgi:transmembrane sensor
VEGLSRDDAAAYWLLARLDGRDLNADAAFATWISDPTHAEAWTRAESIWGEFDVEPDPLLKTMRDTALRARRSPLATIEPALRRFAVAAVVVLALFAGWHSFGPGQWMAPASQTIAAGQSRTEVALEDGSKLTLEPGTRVEISFERSQRNLTLTAGAAQFQVAHDASRPFTVAARDHRVTALGTQFDVALTPAGLRVHLTEGSIAVARPSGTIRLVPGDTYEVKQGSAPLLTHAEAQRTSVGFEGRILEFHGEPLSIAVADMNRSATRIIIIGDASIANFPVTGRFSNSDAEGFVQTLAAIYPIRAITQKDGSLKLLRRR